MKQTWQILGDRRLLALFPLLCLTIPGLVGCNELINTKVEAQPEREQREEPPPAVEVAIARTTQLREPITYTGNTQPAKEVSLRSQVEGRLWQLNVDLGDPVQKGQILARLDDTLLQTALSEAEAELAARESEVSRTRNQVSNAQARIKQAQVELKQAQVDAQRLVNLAEAGAISRQQAELAQTQAAVAVQTLRSAEEESRIEQEAVAIAAKRVKAQRSVVAQVRERRSYTLLTAPLTGVVLQRLTEPGNLVQPGGEVLKIGDFSQVKVVTPVSELTLAQIQIGQTVTVDLDAFPEETFQGYVSRISPAADATTRQIPVEVIISNPNSKIGSGLLAKVKFASQNSQRLVIPETALQGEDQDTIFLLPQDTEAMVEARKVQIGDRFNNLVEILSGLKPGERYVVRSSRPLKSGESVRLSVLSESETRKKGK